MLRFLQRKKGFTIIELIVVIAILGVLMAVILPSISQQRSRINEARSAARDFYAAVQTVMNYFSVFDGKVLPDDPETGKETRDVVHYYREMGGNYPFDNVYRSDPDEIAKMIYPDETAMYIMVYAKNRSIEKIGIVTKEKNKNNTDNGMFQLLKREEKDRNTKFGDIFKGEIKDRVSFNDGYYYAKLKFEYPSGMDMTGEPVDAYLSTVKVEYTAFCRKELPDTSSLSYDEFLYQLTFGKDYVLNWNGGEICGTCASRDEDNSVGFAGTTLT